MYLFYVDVLLFVVFQYCAGLLCLLLLCVALSLCVDRSHWRCSTMVAHRLLSLYRSYPCCYAGFCSLCRMVHSSHVCSCVPLPLTYTTSRVHLWTRQSAVLHWFRLAASFCRRQRETISSVPLCFTHSLQYSHSDSHVPYSPCLATLPPTSHLPQPPPGKARIAIAMRSSLRSR